MALSQSGTVGTGMLAGRPEKLRSPQEILARYNLRLQQYKELNAAHEDNREQRLMLYTEIKALAWILGKDEKTVIRAMNT